jgi:hypothetical protein
VIARNRRDRKSKTALPRIDADSARIGMDRYIGGIGKAKTNLPFAYFASIAVKGFAFQFSILAITAILAILAI